MIENNTDFISQALGYAIAWSPAFLAYLLLRTAAVRTALYYMMRQSLHVFPEPENFETVKTGITESPKPEISVFNSSFDITPKDDVLKHRWNNSFKSGMRSWWSFVLAIAFFTGSLSILLDFSIKHSDIDEGSIYQNILAGFLPVILYSAIAIAFFTNAVRVYLLGYLPFVRGLITCVVLAALVFLIAPTYGKSPALCALPGIFCLAYFIWSHRSRLIEERDDGNHRLLILRVFDADRNTAFTFGELSHFWRFIGSTITIVDPSYLRFRYSLAYPRNKLRIMQILFYVAFGLTIISLMLGGLQYVLPPSWRMVFEMPHQARIDLLGMVAWVVFIPLAFLPMVNTIKRRFISREADLQRHLSMVKNDQVSRDGVYQDISLYCHSNAWKPVVNQLIEFASVILMDLRGLTPERAGSLYELDLVINRIPLERVVFLTNDEAEHQQLINLLREKLADAEVGSPNRKDGSIELRIYQPGRYESGDTEKLLALLATATARPAPGLIRAEVRVPSGWQRFKSVMAKPGQIWRILTEQVDMAVSRPPYAYAIIPVLLLLVITLFTYRISPLLNTWATYMNPSTVKVLENNRTSMAIGEQESTSIEVRDYHVILNKYLGGPVELSVRLDITSNWAGQAVEFGQVEIHKAIGDQQQLLAVKKVQSSSSSPDLRYKLSAVPRSLGYNYIVNGEVTEFNRNPNNPDGSVRLWLKFDLQESINMIEMIEGSVLLKRPNPKLSTQIKLPPLGDTKSIMFTFPGLESLGEFKYSVHKVSKEMFLEFSKPLPNGAKIYATEQNGTRRIANGYNRISSGQGEQKITTYYRTFELLSQQDIGFEIVMPGDLLEIRQSFYAKNIPIEQP